MDSSDNHRSKVPISVNIASGAEPVDCEGHFCEQDDGFVLEFGTPSAKYVITHGKDSTKLSASGILSYVLDFSDGGATEVVTAVGGIKFSLIPIRRDVVRDSDGVKLDFEYKLVGVDEQSLRAVKIDARFLR